MKFHVITIFPELFDSFRCTALIGKGVERGLLNFNLIQLRDFAKPPHYKVDDTPYGGGAGMVLKPEPLSAAIDSFKKKPHTILLSPSGKPLTQQAAHRLSERDEILILCGRYEGVDQRVIDTYVDEEISIGDFVVMGGEVPAMALIEAIAREIPDVLGNATSIENESFSRTRSEDLLLEGPQYTRPPEFLEQKVPEVLLSGDHAAIEAWREEQSRKRTAAVRGERK